MRRVDIENIYSYFVCLVGYRAVMHTLFVQAYIRIRFRILPTDAILALYMFILCHVNQKF